MKIPIFLNWPAIQRKSSGDIRTFYEILTLKKSSISGDSKNHWAMRNLKDDWSVLPATTCPADGGGRGKELFCNFSVWSIIHKASMISRLTALSQDTISTALPKKSRGFTLPANSSMTRRGCIIMGRGITIPPSAVL